jgi:hypothetical protein
VTDANMGIAIPILGIQAEPPKKAGTSGRGSLNKVPRLRQYGNFFDGELAVKLRLTGRFQSEQMLHAEAANSGGH